MVYQCNARDRRCKMKANRTWAAKNNFLSLAKFDYHFITFGPTQDLIKLRCHINSTILWNKQINVIGVLAEHMTSSVT